MMDEVRETSENVAMLCYQRGRLCGEFAWDAVLLEYLGCRLVGRRRKRSGGTRCWIDNRSGCARGAPELGELRRSLELWLPELSTLRTLPLDQAFRLVMDVPVDGASLRAALASIAPVRWVEPNAVWRPALEPPDPQFPLQWGLSNFGQTLDSFADVNDQAVRPADGVTDDGTAGFDIGARDAWDLTTGSGNVRVAVVDTGMDRNHPDLADNFWFNDAELQGMPEVDDDGNGFVDDRYGWDACNGDGNPEDLIGHGTQVAGIIGASADTTGVVGVAWDVELVAVKFLSALPTTAGSECNLTSGALRALDYVDAIDADVVNMSWGGPENSQALRDKLVELADQGMVLVAAAGNEGVDMETTPFFPAAFAIDGMITVGAHTNDGLPASFSNRGASIVDISAPGVSVRTDTPEFDDGFDSDNFNAYTDDPRSLPAGPIANTDFEVVESDSGWGIAELTNGDIVVIGDFQEGPLEDWIAHRGDLDQTLVSAPFDAASFGTAVLSFEVVHNLGDDAEAWLELNTGDGIWRQLPEDLGRYTGLGAAQETLNVSALLGPEVTTTTSLQVRFRSRADEPNESMQVPGGFYLTNVRWIRPISVTGGTQQFIQGTSFAAPFVAGAAALVRDRFPALTPAQVVDRLVDRSGALRVAGTGVGGDRRLQLAYALSDAPLLTWVDEPGFGADGHDPEAPFAGEPIAFAARIDDPQAAATAVDWQLEVRPAGIDDVEVVAVERTGDRLSVEVEIADAGDYEYRFAAPAADGLIGAPTAWQALEVVPAGLGDDPPDGGVIGDGDNGGGGCSAGGASAALGVLWMLPWLGLWRRRR